MFLCSKYTNNIKRLELSVNYSFDFPLFGIVANEMPHRLVWFLNQLGHLNFYRDHDYELHFDEQLLSFPCFSFIDEENHLNFTLIGNKDDNQWLIPEYKHVDFIIAVQGAIDFFDEEHFKQLVMKSKVVQLIFSVDVNKLKSKNNLILLHEI